MCKVVLCVLEGILLQVREPLSGPVTGVFTFLARSNELRLPLGIWGTVGPAATSIASVKALDVCSRVSRAVVCVFGLSVATEGPGATGPNACMPFGGGAALAAASADGADGTTARPLRVV